MDDSLRERARRAHERGRLQSALGWALWPIGVAAIAAWSNSASLWIAVAAGALLATLVVTARQRGGALGRAALSGLAAGTLAFGLARAAVLLARTDELACIRGSAPGACAACGIAIGAIVGLSAKPLGRPAHAALAALIAGTCGALGCACAGIGAVLGLGLGLIVTTAPWLVVRAASR